MTDIQIALNSDRMQKLLSHPSPSVQKMGFEMLETLKLTEEEKDFLVPTFQKNLESNVDESVCLVLENIKGFSKVEKLIPSIFQGFCLFLS